ncbi:MAG: DUF302 domain-containing protein [Myxococcales bacterium]
MDPHESVTSLEIEHVTVSTARPFADVTELLEARTGVFDRSLVEARIQAGSPAAALAAIEGMSGASGFMRFAAFDHGAILRMRGQAAQAIRYLLGHPLIAARMTARQLATGLYAPVSVLVASGPGGTRIEYDRPSSLLRSFGDEEVTRVALELDAKLGALVRAVAD